MNNHNKINCFMKKGWCPVPYKHHPIHIKTAIKAANFKPQMKCCHANAQKLILMQNKVNLQYVEGIVASIVPIKHAWVIDENNQHHDITSNPALKPICYKVYSKQDLITNINETRMFTFVNDEWLDLMQQAIFLGIDFNLPIEEIHKQIIARRKFMYEKKQSFLNSAI